MTRGTGPFRVIPQPWLPTVTGQVWSGSQTGPRATLGATQRWWRTMTAATMADARTDLDSWCARVADRRRRPKARLERVGMATDHRPTVAELGDAEPLRELPVVGYPATATVERVVDAHAAGDRSSTTPWSPPPCWTGSYTAPPCCRSTARATACAPTSDVLTICAKRQRPRDIPNLP